MNTSLRTHSAGYSLVELMIAMGLGLFLMAGVIQVLVGGSQTHGVVTSNSQARESGRFGLFFLTQSLRHAGFWGETEIRRQFDAHEVFAKNAIIFGSNDDSTAATVLDGTDELYVRMTGAENGNIRTCLGGTLTHEQIAIDHYFIGLRLGTEKAPSLYCTSKTYDLSLASYEITTPDTPITSTQPLLNGIENMQILYGFSSAAGMRYVTANNVPADDWKDIESLKIAILSTSNESASGLNNTQSYTLLDQTISVDDKRPRMIFQQLVSLRNVF